ncbi:MAG: EAL domain-containing protein [Acidobacteriota bacterium]
MNFQKLTKGYMWVVRFGGIATILQALWNVPLERVTFNFLLLFCFTIGIGSRMTVQIPRFKSHIAVSDTFVFLALLIYGGELAIILAALEAAFSSWRFCTRKLTVFFNAAAMALSTSAVVFVLSIAGFYQGGQVVNPSGKTANFLVTLSAIVLTYFLVNTSLASIHDSLKNGIPLWDTWKDKYVWTFFSYFIAAAVAGALVRLSYTFGPSVVIASLPMIFFLHLAYRMYLKNVEISILQADQAHEYAKTLEERTAALRDSEQRFRSAFTYAPIGIALVSPTGTWLKVNRAMSVILGYTDAEFLSTDFQSMIFQEDLPATLVSINQILAGKTENCQMEQRYVHKKGHTVWTSWSLSAASDVHSDNVGLIFQLQDVTDKKLAQEKLQHEATHDALTGLPNRLFFMRRLAEALQKSKQNPRYQVSILFIDLDRFKYVNDSLGHLSGDRLLIGISQRLRECMRPPDIVARLGGDEFVILVEGRYYMEKVTRIAERIQRKFNLPFDVGGHEIYSSASIGILHATDKHRSSEDMMRDADTAMYHAKRAGKARHEVFDEKMHRAANETLRLETDLRRAVENDELSIAYQPIFSVADRSLMGVETLTRWEHPELGNITPGKFIPLAEEIGLIEELSEKILRRSCKEISMVDGLFERYSGFRLNVNLSCRHFARPTMVGKIDEILDETNFAPNRLRLEITESVVFEHQQRAVEMLHDLRQLGIEIAIDDFGTGYSNLSYLVSLPISSLKIDRSFISAIGNDGGNSAMVRTMVTMAHSLGLSVVAEGVETEAQLEVLRELNCELAQGFLLARPMSLSEFKKFVADDVSLFTAGQSEIASVSLVQ